MKRVICLIVVLIAMIQFTTFADQIDLSALSDDDVIALNAKLEDELVVRGLAKSGELGEGAYEVGVDIASGSYTVYKMEGCNYAAFFVYPSKDVYEEFVALSKEISIMTDKVDMLGDDPVIVNLRDGEIMEINMGNVKLVENKNGLTP